MNNLQRQQLNLKYTVKHQAISIIIIIGEFWMQDIGSSINQPDNFLPVKNVTVYYTTLYRLPSLA